MRDEVQRVQGEAREIRTQVDQQQQAFVQQARMEAGQFEGRIRREAERTVEQERGAIRDEFRAAQRTLIAQRATLEADAGIVSNRARINEEREEQLKRCELTLIAQEEALLNSHKAVQQQRRELEEARVAQQRAIKRLEAREQRLGCEGPQFTPSPADGPPGITRSDANQPTPVGLGDSLAVHLHGPVGASGPATPRRGHALTPESSRAVRREAEKISFSEFPTLAGLTQWKTNVTYTVAVASGAADTGPETVWLSVAWSTHVGLDVVRDPSP